MPEILIADEAGACFGVERALKMVREEARASEGPFHTLGPLIHNPGVVAELEDLGVTVVDDVDVEPQATIVLRTHGVPPELEERARATGARVLDATCPFVKRVHRAVARLESEGYQVLVVGEKGHPEVEGTLGYAKNAIVVESADALAELELPRKVGVVVQTTQSKALLREVVARLVGKADELHVVDTICEATAGHQDACARLARMVDVMIVVGGKTSANTTHLADISRCTCPRTHHIETPDELLAAWFVGAQRIGITAGASTPASHIEAVRARIQELVEG